MGNQKTEKKESELIITRTFDAPRVLVFEAHSECRHLMNWWGPREWPLATCEMDFREGGSWLYCMKGPKGDLACGKALYREISRPDKIVYEDHFADQNGNITSEFPSGLITFEFTEENGKTTVVNRSVYPTVSDLEKVIEMGAIEGFTETWDRLEELLAALVS